MKVIAYNIKYKNNTAIISVCGNSALMDFMDLGIGDNNKTTSNSAPTACQLEINLLDAWDTEANDWQIKIAIEQKTGFEVATFDYRILMKP